MSAIETITIGPGQRIVLLPSITQLGADHKNAVIVTGSHGGLSVVQYAIRVPVRMIFFNDAGVGKDQAGISALAALAELAIAAAAYSHDSARIGDPMDGWTNGIISHVNGIALKAGIAALQSVHAATHALYQSDHL